MSSTITYADEHDNDITIAVNAIIQKGIAAGTMDDNDADILRDLLIRIKEDAKLITAYSKFSSFISGLNFHCITDASTVSNDDDLSDDTNTNL